MNLWKRNRLRVLRAERRWTQDKLADRVRVSQGTVSLWETAKLEPTDDEKRVLAKAFGVPVEALVLTEALSA